MIRKYASSKIMKFMAPGLGVIVLGWGSNHYRVKINILKIFSFAPKYLGNDLLRKYIVMIR